MLNVLPKKPFSTRRWVYFIIFIYKNFKQNYSLQCRICLYLEKSLKTNSKKNLVVISLFFFLFSFDSHGIGSEYVELFVLSKVDC